MTYKGGSEIHTLKAVWIVLNSMVSWLNYLPVKLLTPRADAVCLRIVHSYIGVVNPIIIVVKLIMCSVTIYGVCIYLCIRV